MLIGISKDYTKTTDDSVVAATNSHLGVVRVVNIAPIEIVIVGKPFGYLSITTSTISVWAS